MHCLRLLPLLGLLFAAACQSAPAAPPQSSAPPLPAAQAAAAVAQPASPTSAAVAQPPAAPPPPPTLTTVRVGTNNAAADAPFHIAQERGYLREQGLELEFTPFDSAQQMITPLGADQLDVGGGGPGPGLFNAILRGVNVRIVVDRARAAPGSRFNCLMVRKDLLDSGTVSTMADLRGRVFAEPVPGNVMTYVYERELRQAGVRPDEVTYATVPFPEMMSAFANGVIDSAIPVEPFNTLGAQRGIAECWRYTGEMDPNFQIAVVLFGPAFAEQRADTARRFTVAHLQAMRDYYRAFFGDGQGRSELLELLARTTSVRDIALLERVAPTWMDPNGSVNVASLQAVQRWYLERGELTSELDLARVVDPSFLDYAISRLGRYPSS